jgi:murein DD-endopeptidase MepM/ murein hydrolase activator NlpD
VSADRTPPELFSGAGRTAAVPLAGEVDGGQPIDAKYRMTDELLSVLIDSAASTLELPANFLDADRNGTTIRRGLLQAIKDESGGVPNVVQAILGDGNDAYPSRARGLFQFVPSTFWAWRVPPHENVFNPFDNILAAMNAMRHMSSAATASAPIDLRSEGLGIWLTGGGWSPRGTNPYVNGSEEAAAGGTTGAQIECGSLPTALGPGGRVAPLAGPIVVTSDFGPRESPGRIGSTYHEGIDLDCSTGDPVLATELGRVSFAGPAGGYGNRLVVDHADFQTSYNHLSGITASVGATVTAGTRIGLCGSTGHSTGSHLHFELIRNGAPVDPARYLSQTGPWSPAN